MEDVLQVPVSRGYLAKLCTGTISASRAAACMAGHLLDRQNKMAHVPGLMVRSQDSRTNRPGLS